MKILNNLNLFKNELQNAAIHKLADDPANGIEGQIYFNTADKELKIAVLRTVDEEPTIVWEVVGKEYGIAATETDDGVDIVLTSSDNEEDTISLVAGTDLTISASGEVIEIAHATITTTPTDDTGAPAFNGEFDVIDSVTIDNGHVTGYNVKTITLPTETTLSVVDAGEGTWITSIVEDDHQITVSRSDTTTATITVGELVINKELDGETVVSTGDLTVGGDTVTTGDLTVGGNAIITGNLTVSGTTTTLNTQTLEIEDNIISINSNLTAQTEPGTEAGQDSSTNTDGGIEVKRFEWNASTSAWVAANFNFLFVEATNDFRLGKAGSLQPVLTRDELGNLAAGDLLVWDANNKRAVGQTFDELNLPNKYAVTIPTEGNLAEGQTYTVTHNLGTEDVVVSLRDVATKEFVQADVVVATVNTITIAVAFIGDVQTIRVVVIG
jgi:hypothetical protein